MLVLQVALGNIPRGVCLDPRLYYKRSSPRLSAELPVLVAPAADVPRDIAAFSGTWAGRWANTLDHVLVVEKIEGRNVTFIYSWGVAPAWNITTPGFVRVIGTVDEGGILRGTLS